MINGLLKTPRRLLLAGAVLLTGTAHAASEDFRLLEVGGAAVKWGEARFDAGAQVTWALQQGDRRDPDAINCKATTGMDDLLTRSGVAPEVLREQIAAAFAMWQAATNLSFVPTAPGVPADIVIGAQIAPRGIAWTNIEYSISGGASPAPVVASLTRASICLNPEVSWRVGFDGDLETYDLRHVIAHEIGHAIGLDHPGRTGQLMGFAYQENLQDLTAGDVSGAVRLYGRRPAHDAVETEAGGSREGGTPSR